MFPVQRDFPFWKMNSMSCSWIDEQQPHFTLLFDTNSMSNPLHHCIQRYTLSSSHVPWKTFNQSVFFYFHVIANNFWSCTSRTVLVYVSCANTRSRLCSAVFFIIWITELFSYITNIPATVYICVCILHKTVISRPWECLFVARHSKMQLQPRQH